MPDQLYTTRGVIRNYRTLADLAARAAGDDAAANEAEALMTLARERALRPEAFDRYPPAFFTVDASTSNVDAYSTIMAESTLANFAADAAEGRAVLDSHNSYENGFGKSLTGEVIDAGNARAMRSSFFTISGYRNKGFDTDSLIAGIETGLHSDISVGFHIPAAEGRMTCSICGEDMLDWEACPHFAGLAYQSEGGKEKRVAIGTIENARLSEYSLVYDGATPGAAVVKAIGMIEAGEVDRSTVERLSRAYGRSFPTKSRFIITEKPPIGDGTARSKESEPMLEELLVVATERGIRIRTGADADEVVKAFAAHIDGLAADREIAETNERAAQETIATLRKEAEDNARLIEDGKQYRDAAIDAAVKAQIRTLAPESAASFNQEAAKRYFGTMDIADIEATTRNFEAMSQFEPGRESSNSGTRKPADGDRPNPVTARLSRMFQDQ